MSRTGLLAPFIFVLAALLSLAPNQNLSAMETATQQEQTKDAPFPISKQARNFIDKNVAPSLQAPLTKQRAIEMRHKTADGKQKLMTLASHLQCSISNLQISGVEVFRISPEAISPDRENQIALYIHGGGYVLKSALDVTSLLMAHQLHMPVYSIEYSLAPEHPFPAGLDDCMAVYEAFSNRLKAGKVVAFGGSAGGGLALAMLLQAKRNGLPMPKALGLFSPWSDLSRTGDSYFANEGRDPVLKWKNNLEYFASAYAGDKSRNNPLLSPIYGKYKGFPPTLIITGTRDLFLSNSVRLSRRMRLAGVDAELRVWESMFHGFDLMQDLPEGREARLEMANFLIQAGQVKPKISQTHPAATPPK